MSEAAVNNISYALVKQDTNMLYIPILHEDTCNIT